MPSKTVIDHHLQATSILSGVRSNRRRLSDSLEERMGRHGLAEILLAPPEPEAPDLEPIRAGTRRTISSLRAVQAESGSLEVPDFDHLQRFVEASLAHYTAEMLALDDLHLQIRQQSWVMRRKRDEAMEEADRVLKEVRGLIGLALDASAASSILGLTGRMPDTPFALRDHLAAAIERMEDPQTFFPEIRITGLQQDWQRLIERLREVLEPLHEALEAVEDDRRRAEIALLDKRDAIERYRDAYVGLGGMLRGLYVFGGQRELARRLNLTLSSTSSGEPDPATEIDLPFPDPPDVPPDDAEEAEPDLPVS